VLATSCLAATFGLVAVLAPAPALAEFGSPQTVSSDASGSPQVAADPQGNAVAVWRGGSTVRAAFRPADGSFGAPQTVSGDPGSTYDHRVAIDSEGNAVAVWTRYTFATTGCVPRIDPCVGGTVITTAVEAAFRPRDGSFGPVQRIATGEYVDGGTVLHSARVAISPEGDAIAIWVSDRDGNGVVEERIESASAPAGGIFGPSQAISTSTSFSYSEPDIAVGSQGTAVAVWERRGGTDSRIEAAFSPGGGVFGTTQTISDTFSYLPDVAVDPAGGAVAVWQRADAIGTGDSRIEAAFRPAGGSFGDVQTVSPGGSYPRVAVDPGGGAVAVWERYLDAQSRIEAAFRPPGGSFGAPQPISDPGESYSAQVAVDPDGVAVALWIGSGQIQAAFRPAGGSFGDVQTVSDAGGNVDSPQVTVDSEGGAVAVWRRSVDSESRIEAAFHPPTADIALTNSGSPDRVFVGELLTYTLGVTNNGPSNASGVTLTDLLPRSVRLRSARSDRGRCAQRSPRRIECNLAELSSGETATVTIVVRPTRRGTILNTATVRASQPIDSNPANNTATASTTVE
jgi:uncharacterized repeat protein (TIGR01451 family)